MPGTSCKPAKAVEWALKRAVLAASYETLGRIFLAAAANPVPMPTPPEVDFRTYRPHPPIVVPAAAPIVVPAAGAPPDAGAGAPHADAPPDAGADQFRRLDINGSFFFSSCLMIIL